MKVAYITDHILPRTATDTRQLVSMASAFGEAGASVTLIVPRRWFSPEPDPLEVAAFYGVNPTFTMKSVPSVYPNIRGVEKLAHGIAGPLIHAARDADLIYTRTLPIVSGALLLGKRPVVYETYRPWPLQRPQSRPLLARMGRHPRLLGAILHSNYARNAYAAIGIPTEKLITAYNSYWPSHLSPALTREEAREICGLASEAKIVTYAGGLRREKGVHLLLELARALPEVTFVLVGSETNGSVERSAKHLANVKVVRWHPESALAPFLYAADVLVIPPTSRPLTEVGDTVLPIKTFLYMAAGRAILGPDTPDLAEILVHGENACLVPPDDPDTAKRCLKDLLDNERIRESLAQAALEKVQPLTWERRARKVLHFVAERLEALRSAT